SQGFIVKGAGWHCRVHPLRLDLATALERLPFPDGGLVTASALLDLVSAHWLDALLNRCRETRCQLLFALSYDGRCALTPSHADDATLIDIVNRHQRTDKGFGPALGPDAAAHAQTRCQSLGYQTMSATSDWRVGGDQPRLQRTLISGWRRVALELEPARSDRIDRWYLAHERLVDDGRLLMTVGHRDLLATL
ncbi:MAG: class I SAM-dependent methyltransferase, partial [Thiohalocapsa sp.]